MSIKRRHSIPTCYAGRPFNYLLAYNGGPNGSNYAIGQATSQDLIYWQKAAAPILTFGTGWESTLVKDPHLLKVGSTYYLYYSGQDGTHYQIGLATSTDGFSWTKYGSNPVLTRGGAGAWDEHDARFGYVIYDPAEADSTRRWKMWYCGNSAAAPTVEKIGYAYSSDGISWTKYASNPVVSPGAGGTYDDEGCGSPVVYRTSSTDWSLFYGGRPNVGVAISGDTICLATFSTPESSYTKSGSNPLYSPSTASQSLTANLGPGSARLAVVGSTTGFAANDPVLLLDPTNGNEDARVLSVDSSTQMTLVAAPTNTYTVANGASILALMYGSISPKSIILLGGTYYLFVVPFQQFSGSPFQERTAVLSASSLSGPWTLDKARSPMLPLNVSWDSASAENPSVIVA